MGLLTSTPSKTKEQPSRSCCQSTTNQNNRINSNQIELVRFLRPQHLVLLAFVAPLRLNSTLGFQTTFRKQKRPVNNDTALNYVVEICMLFHLAQIWHRTRKRRNSRHIHTCNQQVDIVCSFIRYNRFQVCHVAHD